MVCFVNFFEPQDSLPYYKFDEKLGLTHKDKIIEKILSYQQTLGDKEIKIDLSGELMINKRNGSLNNANLDNLNASESIAKEYIGNNKFQIAKLKLNYYLFIKIM